MTDHGPLTITAGTITAGTITAAQITAGAITSDSITLGGGWRYPTAAGYTFTLPASYPWSTKWITDLGPFLVLLHDE